MADIKENQGQKVYLPEQIKMASDMMRILEEEIAAMKNGEMAVEVSRVVLRGRALQIKVVELGIKYHNLLRRGKPLPMDMPLLGGEAEEKKPN